MHGVNRGVDVAAGLVTIDEGLIHKYDVLLLRAVAAVVKLCDFA